MSIARAAARKLMWMLLSIVAVTLLLAAIELVSQGFLQARQQLEAIAGTQKTLPRMAADEVTGARERVQQLRHASGEALRGRLADIERELSQHAGRAALRTLPPHEVALLALRGELAARVKSELQMDLWRQEQSYLTRLLQLTNYRNAAEQVRQLELDRDAAYAEREAKHARYRDAWSRLSAFERGISAVLKTADSVAADAARQSWHDAIRKHSGLYERAAQLRREMLRLPGSADPGPFMPVIDGTASSLGEILGTASAATQDVINAHWLHRVAQAWWPYVIDASRMIAVLVSLYVGWKAMFFFVVAPWISGRPAIRIESAPTSGDRPPPMGHSAVSLQVTLAPGQELLIKDSYLQDSPSAARASTRMFLNGQYPIACMASGMFGLTCIEAGLSPVAVTVSSTVEPLDELAHIPLTPASGFVLLPRFLVAAVQASGEPIVIRSVWRLWSLQAWLTFQFRYLVFSGSGSVIVRGCRGVRVDRPDGNRRIAQAATIGFDACLHYSNRRIETFLPYLLGMKPLLHDSFSGEGFYAYQEVPATRGQGAGGEGRVMGALDALLKPFGI